VADGKAGFNGKPAGWRGFTSAGLGVAQQASLRYSASPACEHISETAFEVLSCNGFKASIRIFRVKYIANIFLYFIVCIIHSNYGNAIVKG